MSAASIFSETIPARFNDPADKEKMMALNAVFQFNITGDEEGSWFVDLKAGTTGEGTHDEADCTITMEASDFIDLYNGDAQGPMLFMGGKLQIEGNMGLALQLGEIMG
jgi:putative sterol carrier protein